MADLPNLKNGNVRERPVEEKEDKASSRVSGASKTSQTSTSSSQGRKTSSQRRLAQNRPPSDCPLLRHLASNSVVSPQQIDGSPFAHASNASDLWSLHDLSDLERTLSEEEGSAGEEQQDGGGSRSLLRSASLRMSRSLSQLSESFLSAMPDVETLRSLAALLRATLERNAHEVPPLDIGELLFCLVMYVQYRLDEETSLHPHDEENDDDEQNSNQNQGERTEGKAQRWQAKAPTDASSEARLKETWDLFRFYVDFAEAAYANSLEEVAAKTGYTVVTKDTKTKRKERFAPPAAPATEEEREPPKAKSMQVFRHSFVSSSSGPAFILCRLPEEKIILLSIRGTASLHDALVDLRLTTKRFLNGYAHEGMLHLAKELVKLILPKIRKLCQKYKDHRFVCTGHSMGAGVACLLTMLLVHEYKFKACVTEELVSSTSNIISLLYASDLIPTLSEHNLLLLMRELHDFSKRREHTTLFSQKLEELWQRNVAVRGAWEKVSDMMDGSIGQNVYATYEHTRHRLHHVADYVEATVGSTHLSRARRWYRQLKAFIWQMAASFWSYVKQTSPLTNMAITLTTRVLLLPIVRRIPHVRSTGTYRLLCGPQMAYAPFRSATTTMLTVLMVQTGYEAWKVHVSQRLDTRWLRQSEEHNDARAEGDSDANDSVEGPTRKGVHKRTDSEAKAALQNPNKSEKEAKAGSREVQVLYSPAHLFWLRAANRPRQHSKKGPDSGSEEKPHTSFKENEEITSEDETHEDDTTEEEAYVIMEAAPKTFDRIKFHRSMVGDHLLGAYRHGLIHVHWQ